MSENKGLIISICIFIIVGMSALLLILNKGHIGTIGLVNLKEDSTEIEKNIDFKISADKKFLSIKDKEEAELSASVDGDDIVADINYTSSDEDVAKIKDGKVIPVKKGKATITGTYKGKTDKKDIYVITPIKNMTFTSTSSSIRVGRELQMKLQLTPSDADVSPLKYYSSDEDIATVNSNGIVTGVSAGKVTITVKDEYTGKEKSVNLTIRK